MYGAVPQMACTKRLCALGSMMLILSVKGPLCCVRLVEWHAAIQLSGSIASSVVQALVGSRYFCSHRPLVEVQLLGGTACKGRKQNAADLDVSPSRFPSSSAPCWK